MPNASQLFTCVGWLPSIAMSEKMERLLLWDFAHVLLVVSAESCYFKDFTKSFIGEEFRLSLSL